jgi:chromosome segregation ATPase
VVKEPSPITVAIVTSTLMAPEQPTPTAEQPMMDTLVSKDTAKTLMDTVGMVKLIDQSDKRIQAQFKRMFDGLQRGIANSSEDEIALYRPELAKAVGEIDRCLNSVQAALGLLAQLRADQALMETRFDQIEKLVRSVAGKRRKLSERAAAARKLDADSEQAVDAIKKGALSAEADLGALKDQVGGLMKTIAYVSRESLKLEGAARDAHERGDQRTLTDTRVKLIGFLKYGAAASALRPRIEKYAAQYPDIDSRAKAQVQWLLDDVQRALDCIDEVDKVVKGLIALGQVAQEEPDDKPRLSHGPEARQA